MTGYRTQIVPYFPKLLLRTLSPQSPWDACWNEFLRKLSLWCSVFWPSHLSRRWRRIFWKAKMSMECKPYVSRHEVHTENYACPFLFWMWFGNLANFTHILQGHFNWPNSEIPECTCSISQNAPFRTEMCTFLFWMEHSGIWNRCILGIVKLVHCIGAIMRPFQYQWSKNGK